MAIIGLPTITYGINKIRKANLGATKMAVAWELEDQLKELKGKFDRGALTQEEYERKKKELLERKDPRM